ncbi:MULTISPECIES: hypothetical protein [Saccharothrix]|uniref:Uncharacterized protein n=1 Tax=Saccharothrix longispora TaxID=33920 RepID=A0ABU1PXG6_9PSEU|nr:MULTISPECIES: hypothetical protein [Saccharothrix]MDR6594569.1 hypothetical protein [Saccharothrix longispora]
MNTANNTDAPRSVVAGLVDGFILVYRDHDDCVSFRVVLGPPGAPPEECDHIELVLGDEAVRDLGAALEVSRVDGTPISCSVGVHRRAGPRAG